jgi:acyl-[acyl-carrier-protein]-phospholipid O-acyltransferase/long-chain-fatty-acid--[acyl-carrier-protein] ligase
MARYFAIILGTVAGGAVLSLWRDDPAITGCLLIAIALLGWASSLGIAQTRMPGAPMSIGSSSPERFIAWRRLAAEPRLRSVVLGAGFFDLLCTFNMMDMLLLARETLKLGDFEIGLISCAVAVGIGIGSGLAGYLCRNHVRVGLAPIGAAGVGSALVGTWLLSDSFAGTAATMAFLGLSGGLFVVPLLTLLQRLSRTRERGRILATANFFAMACVLLATILVWLLHDVSGLPARTLLLFAAAPALIAAGVSWRAQRRGGSAFHQRAAYATAPRLAVT